MTAFDWFSDCNYTFLWYGNVVLNLRGKYFEVELNLFAGNYTCQVEWSGNQEPLTVTHELKVLVPASIDYVRSLAPMHSLHSLKNNVVTRDGIELADEGFIEVREGDNVTLECKGEGIPEPKIDWVSSVIQGHSSNIISDAMPFCLREKFLQ